MAAGLIANSNAGVASAQFKGVLDVHALKATDLAQFIQNVTGDNNGEHGTKDKNGNSVGWLYNDMTGWVSKPLQPGSTFPLLDVGAKATVQTYRYPSPYNVANGIGTVSNSDGPQTSTPDGGFGGPAGNTGVAPGRHSLFPAVPGMAVQ